MSRRDSKGIFATALGQIGENNEIPMPAKQGGGSPHLRRVAAGVRELQERSELANRLLNDSERIVDFDTGLILPSPIPDRFNSAYSDEALTQIAESMRERGQIVPGMVRPIGSSGKFQIVYGRRRLAVAKLLGLKFKAVIRELTDEQAVILQGEENAERADLSFIEKCVFALAQEKAGFRRDVICASLTTTKSHISEMIKIASAIPPDVLESIGPAPTIGRGRWLEFAECIERDDALLRVREICTRKSALDLKSEERFNLAFKAFGGGKPTTKSPPTRAHSRAWSSSNGRLTFTAKTAAKGLTFNLANHDAEKFGDWFLENADRLYADFLNTDPESNHGD
jgi:ParB family transcriptional regulator, chromosome partitioning protein